MFLVFFAFCSALVLAEQRVRLAWDPSPDPAAAGYKIHYGTSSGAYTNVYDAGLATTATITGLSQLTTYYFAATAYNAQGIQSGFSNEVSTTTGVDPFVTRQSITRLSGGGTSGGIEFLQLYTVFDGSAELPLDWSYTVYTADNPGLPDDEWVIAPEPQLVDVIMDADQYNPSLPGNYVHMYIVVPVLSDSQAYFKVKVDRDVGFSW